MERRKAKFPKLVNGGKEKFENMGQFSSTSGQLQIQEG